MVYLLKKYITQNKSLLPKKWSVWYGVISVVIILQFLVFNLLNFDLNYNFINNYWFLFSIFITTSFWIFFKQILEKNNSYKKEVQDLNQFKKNFNFFQFLCKNIEEYDDFENLKGITFGNKNTATQFTLIVNPNCKKSQADFKEIYDLYLSFPEKINATILFNVPSGDSNSKVAENILTLNKQNPERAKNALIDWFINEIKIENWLKKWIVEAPNLLINKQLQNQHYWCSKNNFNCTPVRIINENLFPDEYKINELKYFIHDFQKENDWEESLKAV